jgi:hypothetical protein
MASYFRVYGVETIELLRSVPVELMNHEPSSDVIPWTMDDVGQFALFDHY